MDSSRHEPAASVQGDSAFPPSPDLVASSPAMRAFHRMLARAAQWDVPVLLLGESGAGKKTHARALHAMSARAAHSFVHVDCLAHADDLEARADTARGGVLFLDEVAGLPAAGQAAALKVLDDSFAGADQDAVRVVASSARDLGTSVKDGCFRGDLFYRLSVVELRIPPLRERPEDILPIARAFLAGVARRMNHPAPALSPELERALLAYAWPGNVTELMSVLERLAILTPGPLLSANGLPERIRG